MAVGVYAGYDVVFYPPTQCLGIAFLHPSCPEWTIKARVISKSTIYTWSKPNSEGKYFIMNLADETGVIKVKAFNEACNIFYNFIEENGLYYFSDCFIKKAEKKYTTIEHNFELYLHPDSVVVPYVNNTINSRIIFNFTPIHALPSTPEKTYVDIIGVCQSVGELQYLNAEKTKREIVLIDETNSSISVVLWNSVAEKFDGTLNPVVAIKTGRVNLFQGIKTVQFAMSSAMKINPEIPEAYKLRKWFESLDRREFVINEDRLWSLKEIVEHQTGQLTSKCYKVEATVLSINSDTCIYKGCINKNCNKKKLEDRKNGTYWCPKCNKKVNTFDYFFYLRVQISDSDCTGNEWITMFHYQAERFLGAKANEIVSSEDMYSYFQKPLLKTYVFQIQAKESLDNESTLWLSVKSFKAIDYKDSSERLVARIKTMSGVSIATQMENFVL